MQPVNRESAIPLYAQIRDSLASEVRAGRLPKGAYLPSEEQLCKSFGVSRMTVRQALQELADLGVIRRVHGVGTVVVEPTLVRELEANIVTGLYDDMARHGRHVRSRVLVNRVQRANHAIAGFLEIEDGASVQHIERLRFVDDQAFSLQSSYLPSDLVPSVPSESLVEGSLYQLLRDSFGMRLTSGETTILAKRATKREAALLGLKRGSALVYAKKLTRCSVGAEQERPIEYVSMVYSPHLYEFRVTSHAQGARAVGAFAAQPR